MSLTALEGTESANVAPGKPGSGLARVKYTHDAMVDLIIAHPQITQNEIAANFGYSVGWVSRIFCSDSFQARLAERREEVINPVLVSSVEHRIKSVTMQSLDILEEKLAMTKNADMALKVLDIGVKAGGYGARQANVAVQNTFVVAMPGKVADPHEWASRHVPSQAVVVGIPSED